MKKIVLLAMATAVIFLFSACRTEIADTGRQSGTPEQSQTAGQNRKAGAKSLGSPYWVKNGVTLVSGDGEAVFEDDDGICKPILSGNGKYVAYSNGGGSLFVYSLGSGSKKNVYTLKGADSADYSVYPVGWSPDSKRVALLTCSSSGFIGGNELIIADVGSGKSNVVAKGIDSADWGGNGQFITADSSEVQIMDEAGEILKTLNTPDMSAFFNASNPAFSPDCKYAVYNCGDTYYIHDMENDAYTELFSVNGGSQQARIGNDGKVIVSDGGSIRIFNPADGSYDVYYDKANSDYPNW